MALSNSSGGSSGWLKAIPQSSLGLAIHGPEFVVGLRLWLGVPLFPVSPLCVCLTPIDCFGDHLLERSHGPMRIRRHDALVDIVCHALFQGVLKEQQVLVKTILTRVMSTTQIFSVALCFTYAADNC